MFRQNLLYFLNGSYDLQQTKKFGKNNFYSMLYFSPDSYLFGAVLISLPIHKTLGLNIVTENYDFPTKVALLGYTFPSSGFNKKNPHFFHNFLSCYKNKKINFYKCLQIRSGWYMSCKEKNNLPLTFQSGKLFLLGAVSLS